MSGKRVSDRSASSTAGQVISGLVLAAIALWILWPALRGPDVELSRSVQAVADDQADGPTLAQFQRVQMGMTYDQVAATLGSPGTLESESRVADIYTCSYHWWGQGDVGANMSVMFQNGRAVSKAQCGLR